MLASFLLFAAPLAVPAAAQSSPAGTPLVLERLLDPALGQTLVQPVDVTALPGDDRLLAVEMGGTVRWISDGTILSQPFLDVSAHITATGLAGLRAMALHPEYDQNGHVFLWYDAPDGAQGLDLVLARMTRSAADPTAVEPSSRVELLRVPQDVRGHGGGGLAFGPNGYLWVALGDGGMQHDPNCRAQDPATLLGKMLRIDVDGAFPYAIPPDNPFVGMVGFAPEIVHLGFRHPWKWSFDRLTGDIWIGDVGQEEREEVNFAAAGDLGLNFGWPVMEGGTCHAQAACPSSVAACGDPVYRASAFEYAHDAGCSVTGGFVYRGTEIPGLHGTYLTTDFCSRRFWAVKQTATGFETVERTLEQRPAGAPPISVSSFGEDGHGEIIVVDHGGGTLYRLVHGCEATTTCLGEVNSLGARSDLRFAGSTSVVANDVTVRLGTLPPMAPALLFVGPETADVPVSGGRLCVGGSIVRLGVRFASQDGHAAFPMDWAAAPFLMGPSEVLPGRSLTFQAWYRQPVPAGGGAGSNFTSATTVTFCP